MSFNIDDIKRLKDLTGVGLTDAKKALQDSNGDFDQALKLMRQKGLTKAEKRSEREARQGMVGTYNHDNRIGVLVEVNCETDFVARNEIFSELVKNIAMQIAASNPIYVKNEDIPESEKSKVYEEFYDKAKLENKPADKIDSIVTNQVSKYFSERCLVAQPYIKDDKITVEDLIKEHISRLGENIVIRRFSRIALGENN